MTVYCDTTEHLGVQTCCVTSRDTQAMACSQQGVVGRHSSNCNLGSALLSNNLPNRVTPAAWTAEVEAVKQWLLLAHWWPQAVGRVQGALALPNHSSAQCPNRQPGP